MIPKTRNAKLLSIAGIVLLIVTMFMLFRALGTGIKYSPTKMNNQAGPIVIKAKKTIQTGVGSYTIKPNAKGHIQVVDNYIIFWPQEGEGFSEEQRYTADFKNYKYTDGSPIKIPQIRFSVDRSTKYSDLQKEVLEEYGRFEGGTNPFLDKLPHTEPYRYKVSYRINYSAENVELGMSEILGTADNWKSKKDNYTVIIETLVTQGRQDSFETYKQHVQKAREEALAWIKSSGVDTQKDIVYEFNPNDQELSSQPNTQNPTLVIPEAE